MTKFTINKANGQNRYCRMLYYESNILKILIFFFRLIVNFHYSETKVLQIKHAEDPYADGVEERKYGHESDQIGDDTADWLKHVNRSY